MKKLFTILCAGLLTLGVSAQTQFGATAGLNMANITDADDSKMRLGIRLGASVSTELSDVMTLQSGLLYSVKGVGAIDFRADNIKNFDSLEKNSIDEYAAIKSLYLQNRAKKIGNTFSSKDDEWDEFNK